MKSKEEILIEFGCPEVSFDENVTMYYPAILSAMDEYAEQNMAEIINSKMPYITIRKLIQKEYDKNPRDTNVGFLDRFAKVVSDCLATTLTK